MNKFIIASALTFCSVALFAQETHQAPEVMTKSKGSYTINTTSLCKTRGFQAGTPLTVVIKEGKIDSVVALPNKETPRFFDRVKKDLLPKYNGLKIEDIEKVDGVTGATLSSRAVKDNVKAAVEHYKANK